MLIRGRGILFFLAVFSFCLTTVAIGEKMPMVGFDFGQEEIDPKKQEIIDAKNERWKSRNINRVRDVNRAYEDYQFGATEAVGALVRALDNDREDVREAANEVLKKIGKNALGHLIEKFNSTNVYMVKKNIMMLMAKTGEDSIVVPILEQAHKDDDRLQASVLETLRSIGSPRAQSASLRIMQSRHLRSRADVDKRIDELGERRVFDSLGLKWGDIKENLITVAWRITQYRKATNPTPRQVEDYELLHQMLLRFIDEYDRELGKGSGLKFLIGHGYSEAILER